MDPWTIGFMLLSSTHPLAFSKLVHYDSYALDAPEASCQDLKILLTFPCSFGSGACAQQSVWRSEDNVKESVLSYHARPVDEEGLLPTEPSCQVLGSCLFLIFVQVSLERFFFPKHLTFPLHSLAYKSLSYGPDIFKSDLFGYGQND